MNDPNEPPVVVMDVDAQDVVLEVLDEVVDPGVVEVVEAVDEDDELVDEDEVLVDVVLEVTPGPVEVVVDDVDWLVVEDPPPPSAPV